MVIALNSLNLVAIVMFGNFFSCRIVDVWSGLSAVVCCFQEDLIRKILSKPFKIPIRDYKGILRC